MLKCHRFGREVNMDSTIFFKIQTANIQDHFVKIILHLIGHYHTCLSPRFHIMCFHGFPIGACSAKQSTDRHAFLHMNAPSPVKGEKNGFGDASSFTCLFRYICLVMTWSCYTHKTGWFFVLICLEDKFLLRSIFLSSSNMTDIFPFRLPETALRPPFTTSTWVQTNHTPLFVATWNICKGELDNWCMSVCTWIKSKPFIKLESWGL